MVKVFFLYLSHNNLREKGEKNGKEFNAKDLSQAETAGENALWSLYLVRDTLTSTKRWGFVDLFGGGLITDLVKHSKIDTAGPQIAKAKEDLLIFEDKLKNIQVPADLRMEIGSFLSFADFFFDGPIADYLIQTEIQKTLEDIDDAITHVESIINSIRLQQEVK